MESLYLNINQRVWDHKAVNQGWYVDTASDADFLDPLKAADPQRWLRPSVVGKRILCLAAGGGRHGPLFATAGASVTVCDLSPAMLEIDRQVAAQRHLDIRLVCDSMENVGRLEADPFDIVFMPVATCYIPSLKPLFQGIAQCLKLDGHFISYHKQAAALQSGATWIGGPHYPMLHPYEEGFPLPPESPSCGHREAGTQEFLHTWEGIIGGLCRSGFVIEDLVEPRHGQSQAQPGTFQHRSVYLPPFVGMKARLIKRVETGKSGMIWT